MTQHRVCFHDWHYDANFKDAVDFHGSAENYLFMARTCEKCHTHQLKYNSHDGLTFKMKRASIDLSTLSFGSAIDWLDCSCDFYSLNIRLHKKILERFPQITKKTCTYWPIRRKAMNMAEPPIICRSPRQKVST